MQDLKSDLPEFLKQSVLEEQGQLKGRSSRADKILNEIMSDPQKSLDLTAFLWLYSKGKISSYTNTVKNDAKQSIIDKLNPAPDFGATGSGNTEGAFSYESFKRSAGI